MLVLGSSCKYRLSLAEGFQYTETIINQLLADLYQNPTSEWQVTIKLHLVAGYRATPHLPGLWKYCLPRSQSMVPVRLGTSVLQCFRCPSHCVKVYTHLFFCSLLSLKGPELLLGNREKGENAFSQRQKELDNYRQKCIFSKLGKMNNHNKI